MAPQCLPESGWSVAPALALGMLFIATSQKDFVIRCFCRTFSGLLKNEELRDKVLKADVEDDRLKDLNQAFSGRFSNSTGG